jgi:hypothetical protein
MRLPDKIRIGYQDVTIEREKASFSKPTDSYGEYDHRKNSITIQSELSNLDEANTLIHEILHGISYTSSLTVGGQPLDTDNKEEVVINQITNGLAQVFRDNPWLASYLKERLR